MKNLTAFYYNDELFVRLIPAKPLFNSTLVHQVVNRGDVFAMRVSDQKLTIIPGKANVIHCEISLLPPPVSPTQKDIFSEAV